MFTKLSLCALIAVALVDMQLCVDRFLERRSEFGVYLRKQVVVRDCLHSNCPTASHAGRVKVPGVTLPRSIRT